ncbi:MAG: hypothetical protein K8R39_11885 [Arcobacteraceae bacterium]|nr:hypothetical protein [Arcobacteraceae bacterium]
MGFFSKVLGMDKTAQDMATLIALHLEAIKSLDFNKKNIQEYLNKNNIDNVIMNDGWLKWQIIFKSKDILTLRLYDENKEDLSVSAYFDIFSNSPLSEISMMCSDKYKDIDIGNYKGYESQMSSIAKVFVETLEELGYKKL